MAKLPQLKMFRLTIDALLENMERYPQVSFPLFPRSKLRIVSIQLIQISCFQDEADALSALFHIGRNHGKFVVRMIEEVSPQVSVPLFAVKLSLILYKYHDPTSCRAWAAPKYEIQSCSVIPNSVPDRVYSNIMMHDMNQDLS